MYEYITPPDRELILTRCSPDMARKVLECVPVVAEEWGLDRLCLIPYFSIGVLFTCRAPVHEFEAVLKIGSADPLQVHHEANVLAEYGGRFYPTLYRYDPHFDALLEQRIRPGYTLLEEPSAEVRIREFGKVFCFLHQAPRNESVYPTYEGWVCRRADYYEPIPEAGSRREHLLRARDLVRDISRRYPRRMLLHGDLHHENLLKGGHGYVPVDPKGVIGDPVFDVSRFILEQFGDCLNPSKKPAVLDFIAALSGETDIPARVLCECLYVETALWAGEDDWNGGDGVEDEFQRILDENTDMAYELLRGSKW